MQVCEVVEDGLSPEEVDSEIRSYRIVMIAKHKYK